MGIIPDCKNFEASSPTAMKKKTISLKRVGKMYRIARMSNCLEIVIDTRIVTVHDLIDNREAQILIDAPNLTINLS